MSSVVMLALFIQFLIISYLVIVNATPETKFSRINRTLIRVVLAALIPGLILGASGAVPGIMAPFGPERFAYFAPLFCVGLFVGVVAQIVRYACRYYDRS